MIALSTAWNAMQHSKAKDILKEIKELGFKHIELNFNLTQHLVQQMLKLKNKGLIEITSVHNFCPLPRGVTRGKASPDIFSLSSLNENERKKAIYYTKKTIATARELDARVVVLHAGRVKMVEKIKQLALLYANNMRKFNKLKKEMFDLRKKRSQRFLDQTLRSIDELCGYAQKKKIKLGLENRYYFSEIPAFDEIGIILDKFPKSPLYYWHDTGHAQIYENLKFFKHTTLLDRFASRMIGIHLHDVEGIDDHRAPLEGKFDFKLLKPYIKRTTIKVMEPHWPTTKDEIARGKKYLERLFD